MTEGSTKGRGFQGRALTTFMMVATFVLVSVSGIVLFFSPNGRLARETGWEMLALNKGDWMDVHIFFGYLCLAVALYHVWLNRKPLLGYFKRRAAGTPRGIRLEWVVALLICIALFMSAKERTFPVSPLLDWHDGLKMQQPHKGRGPSMDRSR